MASKRIKLAIAGAGIIGLAIAGHIVYNVNPSAEKCSMRVVDSQKGFYLPDPKCTPGATDTHVTKAQLCVPGYTSTVRPPVGETDKLKQQLAKAYNVTLDKTFELDHYIPLSLGGSNDVTNLWPEPNRANAKDFNNPKDVIEYRLYREMCDGNITLFDAQKRILNWVNEGA